MRHTDPVVSAQWNLSGPGRHPDDRDTFDLDAIIGFVQRNWRLCAIWIGAALCAAFAFVLVAPAYYTAYATLVLYDSGARPTASDAADAAATAYIDTQIEVLRSYEVVGKVAGRFGLAEDPEFRPGAASAKTQGRQAATIVKVAKALSVTRIGTSEAVAVGFTARSPGRAAEIANAIVRDYIDGVRDRRLRKRAEAVAEIRDRLAEIREKAFGSNPPPDLTAEAPQSAGQSLARFREQQDNSETYRAIYNNLLQQTNTALVSEFTAPSVRVITPAEPPLHKSWPKIVLVLGIAIVIGGIAGTGQALLGELTDRSLRTADGVRRATGLDCIAVPALDGRELAEGAARCAGVQPGHVGSSPELSRALVTLAIKLQCRRQKRPLVVGVAAPGAGVGASTVAAHLANILAETGEKTLLVDADWCKPEQDAGTAGPGQIRMATAGIAAVRLDPGGPKPGGLDVLRLRAVMPVSLVGASLSVLGALQHLPRDCDCVVVDFNAADEAPDLEASVTTLDAVVVVTEAGRTSADALHRLLGAMPNEKIVAIIVNKVAVQPAGFRAAFARFAEPFVSAYRGLSHLVLWPPARLTARCGAWLHWARSHSRQAAPVESGGLDLD